MMRYCYSLVILLFLAACGYDMATYTRFATPACGGDKLAVITPNIYGVDNKIYSATSEWLKKTLTTQGYMFDTGKEANVLVTINHEVLDEKEKNVEVEEEEDPNRLPKSPNAGPLYYHQLIILIDDIGCKKESLTFTVNLETYSPDFNEIIPELLESLKDTFTHTKGPHAKTIKRIERKI
jgi:hypothetical protein